MFPPRVGPLVETHTRRYAIPHLPTVDVLGTEFRFMLQYDKWVTGATASSLSLFTDTRLCAPPVVRPVESESLCALLQEGRRLQEPQPDPEAQL